MISLIAMILGWNAKEMFKKDARFFDDLKGKVESDEDKAAVLMRMVKYIAIITLGVGIMFWQFLGLFTSNWFIFLSLFLAGFLIQAPINRLLGGKRGKTDEERLAYAMKGVNIPLKVFSILWGLMRSCVIVFAVLNAFHFQIDTWQWFLNLFS